MLMFNDSEPFPDPVGIVLARWVRRYRSELAPVAVTGVILGLASWLNATHPQWCGYVLDVAGAGVWLILIFGARVGLAQVIERLYAAMATLAGGAWGCFATVFGPFTSPLPQSLTIGAVILSIPWWAHRRRRAKVRVERQLEAWPDIAKAVGLAGSQVMSAIVDVWGWRARFRLARGQTISDVIAKIPAIESGLGTFRGAVRVYPTPDDKANRCEIRVLDIDPHVNSIPWPGPGVTSITQPIGLGPFEDASQCRVLFLRRHGLFAGATGSGKSNTLNVLIGNLVACRDVVIWAIDLKRGMELKPWASCIDRLATTPEQAAALLRDARAILEVRAEHLAATGRRTWEPSPAMPALVIIIDEFAELKDEAPEALQDADSIARLGRAVAVTLIPATQRPTQRVMGEGAVRSQMNIRICHRVEERKDVDLILGQGMLKAGWNAHALNAPGKFLVSAPEHTTPRRARAYDLPDEIVAATAARYADNRPHLDQISRHALTAPDDIPSVDNSKTPTATTEEKDTQLATEDDALSSALRQAPDEGTDIGELMRITGWKRTKLYRLLQAHARAGRAIQVSRGRWRARTTDDGPSL
jgi:S-DNA-T family DNA segregation ATPase FtsK/SpoIIIE